MGVRIKIACFIASRRTPLAWVPIWPLQRRSAGHAIADPIDGDALFRQHLRYEAVAIAQYGEQEVFVLDFSMAEPIGRIHRHYEPVPEAGRMKCLGQFLLMNPFEGVVAAGRGGMIFIGAGAEEL